ncbi:MAG TPA: hypothetical protein PLL48_16010, partial [Novosphingobium sp.]|nr:hypothetical protein [Novosphingobium sp.]
ERFSLPAPEVFADLSKNLIDEAALALLLQVAEQCQLPARRDALLRGDVANLTEYAGGRIDHAEYIRRSDASSKGTRGSAR